MYGKLPWNMQFMARHVWRRSSESELTLPASERLPTPGDSDIALATRRSTSEVELGKGQQ